MDYRKIGDLDISVFTLGTVQLGIDYGIVGSTQKPTQDVVYTQPGPFNRNRFLLHLAAIVAVVFALLFGMSLFFKVEVVTVAGANKYTEWDVCQAAGIQMGENLLKAEVLIVTEHATKNDAGLMYRII